MRNFPLALANWCFFLILLGTIFLSEPVFADMAIEGGDAGDFITIDLADNYKVYAGKGIDTIAVPLFPNEYRFSQSGENRYIARYQNYKSLFDSIEFIEFGFTWKTRLPVADLLSGTIQDRVAKLTDLYLAFFGRAPDVEGLEYWQRQLLEVGRDFATISKDFSWSKEAQELFPQEGISNEDFVTTVYQNCFGRVPDGPGGEYWLGRFNALDPEDPEYLNKRGSLVGELLLGAYAETSGPEDRSLLINKHAVALAYVNGLSAHPEEGFDAAINTLLAMVSGEPATRYNAEHVIDHVFANAVTLTDVMADQGLLGLWRHDPAYDTDDDGDGWSETQGDCNDSLTTIYPDAYELCNDGIDQDCNGVDQSCQQSAEALTLSTAQAYPGQLLTLEQTGVPSDSLAEVVFTWASGVAVGVFAIADETGALHVSVPPVFDSEGLPVAGQVEVSMNGRTAATPLQVQSFPNPGFATEGAALVALLNNARQSAVDARANLVEISFQTGVNQDAAADALDREIARLEAWILELNRSKELTVKIDGADVVLTAADLDRLDAWLLSSLVALDTRIQQFQVQTARAASDQLPTFELLQERWQAFKDELARLPDNEQRVVELKETVVSLVENTIQEARDAGSYTVTMLAGYLSTVYGGAGFFGDKPLQTVAKARNLVAAQNSAMASGFIAWESGENTDAFLAGNSENFNAGQEVLSQGVRLGSAYVGVVDGRIGDVGSVVNDGLTIKDVLTAAEVELCEVLGSPSLLCDSGGSGDSINVLIYQNFDGQFDNGPNLDPDLADIKLSGGLGFPMLSWPGSSAISALVYDAAAGGNNSLLYGIVSLQDEETGQLIPFGSSVRYGNYSLANTEPAYEVSSVPGMVSGGIYLISVQRSDFSQASLMFTIQ